MWSSCVGPPGLEQFSKALYISYYKIVKSKMRAKIRVKCLAVKNSIIKLHIPMSLTTPDRK